MSVWSKIGADEYGRAVWRRGRWVVAPFYNRIPLGDDRSKPRPSGYEIDGGGDAVASRHSLKAAKAYVDAKVRPA